MSKLLVKSQPDWWLPFTKVLLFQAAMKTNGIITWNPLTLFGMCQCRAPFESTQPLCANGLYAYATKSGCEISQKRNKKFPVPESRLLSGMRRTEESFVPPPNNVNLHNTTQGFCFKRVSSQYISSTLTQLKKKKQLGRQSFSVLNMDIQLIKYFICVCCCMCIKYTKLNYSRS